MFFYKKHKKRGMTLVEVMVASAIFLFISLAVYGTYTGLFNLVKLSRIRVAATNLVNEQFEIARNLPYSSVGLVNGVPSGVLQRVQTLVRDGITFQATTSIQNIDDPFDGTIGGTPNDSAPADYKLIEISVGCSACTNFTPIVFTGRIAPKNLEGSSTNGALFIRVFDANGDPVDDAVLHITNSAVTPSIDITDTSNTLGNYALIDTLPSVNGYKVTVTKPGYSSDRTYPPGGVGLSNPSNPDATVVAQQVTQTSFAIDHTGTINVSSVADNCAPVGGIDYTISGAKTLGTNSGVPVLKYSSNQTTNGSGLNTLSNMEWDTYSFVFNDSQYDLAGTITPIPVSLAPGATQNVTVVVSPKDPRSVLFTVKDAATSQPLTNATVTLINDEGDSTVLITDRGFLKQTDWSGGGGQANFANDATKFFTTDGNIDYSATGGVTLKSIFGVYQTSGTLESSTFDTGSASNFYQFTWNPSAQPNGVGVDSVKFQIATNNDNATWVYKGPDGTAATYYTLANQNISSVNNGNRYLRYKLFMQTADNSVSPLVSDITFAFASSCVPPGQVLFTNLSSGNYTYTVSKSGYQTYNGSVNVNTNWQNQQVMLQVQ